MCPCDEAVAALPAVVCGFFSRPKGIFGPYFWSPNMVRSFLLILWTIVVLLHAPSFNYHMGVTMLTHIAQMAPLLTA